ncbi:hypothetical protein PUNSTDRAFT_122775 [Punctularia strigosozonata HHB-11173 SS5]|uniref:Uncharacterized protein n=1 Tax=Punctularia strigosozonata (strain HHB-11173) TaxID=741275 RepID=R7S333_PUNST|nr:uncharacterized protein PUNSTDRAFT_122775 [Punctularia strigosozonata HHB-11173 SS5]EIN04790.1 hypothetical protein PUNSTDRAFT_122775 [Punctularia strigosozonata HHB-11173 SS5]
MSSTTTPLRLPRLISYFLSFAFGIAGFGLGLHALIQSRKDKSRLHKAVGSTIDLNIDTTDILGAGGALTAATGLTGLLSLVYLVLLLLPHPRTAALPLATRTLPIQAHSLLFCVVFLFATLVPTADFVANNQAKVSATVGGIALPASVIAQAQKLLGATGVYHKLGYLRNIAIVPWFAFLFALTSAILAYLAHSRAKRAAPVAAAAPIQEKNAGTV